MGSEKKSQNGRKCTILEDSIISRSVQGTQNFAKLLGVAELVESNHPIPVIKIQVTKERMLPPIGTQVAAVNLL